MPDVLEFVYVVGARDVDGQGHANNVQIVRWLQEAAVKHSDAQGWTAQRYREAGLTFVVRSHQIRYRESAWQDERLIIRTWISRIGRTSLDRNYEIWRWRSRKLMVEAMTEWALIDADQLRPVRLPEPLVTAFTVTATPSEPPSRLPGSLEEA